jgi:hypothetical protein
MKIRLRMATRQERDDRDITTPAEIREALGMPTAAPVEPLNRHRWCEGDMALLEATAARLEVPIPDQGHARPMPRSGNHG